VAPINEGMWRAAADGRLAVQRCSDCGAHRYPPTEGCYRCASARWAWSDLPGTGTVYSYIWVPLRADPQTRYNVAVITVDGTEGESVRILSNVVDAWADTDLSIGGRVRLHPVRFDDGLALPCFSRGDG
jgi:uncharacterized protein